MAPLYKPSNSKFTQLPVYAWVAGKFRVAFPGVGPESYPTDLPRVAPRIITVWLCLLLVPEFLVFSALSAFSRL